MDVTYDGTAYAGWQIQPRDATVQSRLEDALRELTQLATKVHGSGRTDQGVHARRQVAHFDLRKDLSPAIVRRGLNALLPDDIRVLDVKRVGADFHARGSAVSKEYRYFIWNGDMVPPFLRHYRLRIRQPLDIEAMRKAAALLRGRHDFSAFTANSKRGMEDTVREVHDLRVEKRGREVVIVAGGEGFLYKMVRSLAGWLISVGQGDEPAPATVEILESRRRTSRVRTAMAHALFLWDVTYPRGSAAGATRTRGRGDRRRKDGTPGLIPPSPVRLKESSGAVGRLPGTSATAVVMSNEEHRRHPR